jgi:four helix bundle suffix protein
METSKGIIDNGHSSYSSLLCYKKAVVIYDLTYHFCTRFIDKRDRTYDQMIQAARSGKQNIVEGYTDASTSYEVALKLYNIARGSLKELLEDYHDYLRTRNLRLWELGSKENRAMRQLGKREFDSAYYLNLAESRSDETIANMLIVLLYQEDVVLKNFIESEGSRFATEGGFREKLSRIRLSERDKR